ncbi:MAG TPA: amidohydrolase family protein [Amycolatopsis sp.]|nr:amidohydrolase family protein [Amycolatopsis sp.]
MQCVQVIVVQAVQLSRLRNHGELRRATVRYHLTLYSAWRVFASFVVNKGGPSIPWPVSHLPGKGLLVTMSDLIDVHAHFTPPTTPEEREARWRSMREAQFLAPAPYHWTVDGALDYMNRAGVTMQFLSNIPKTPDALRASNDYGASLVSDHPSRFGLLAALPTDDPPAALAEIERASRDLSADGFAVTCNYNGISLGDASLEPVWAELDRRRATVFAHPDAYAPASLGRPSPLLEVAFETARTIVDMLYAGIFRRFPNMRLIVAHCGGALPALSGRL